MEYYQKLKASSERYGMIDGLVPIVDDGLGNSAYLLELGDGRALAVDPSLDLRAVNRVAAECGLRIAYAAETHLHADFLSGARQLANDHAAQIVASAAGGREFPHTGIADGDEIDLGGLALRALATPGHTLEHMSYLVMDGASELGVFTGGSLLVGAAARTDLVRPDRTEELARAQYRSLRRLVELPDATPVWPTHGAGSFCSAPVGAKRTSTIGAEKAANPLLQTDGEDGFVDALLAGLGSYPDYFDRLAEVNRRGPEILSGAPELPSLDVAEVRRLVSDGASLVDVRPVADYAAGHVPGSVSIALRSQFATWLGWLIDPEVPTVIVRNPDQDAAEIQWPALNIGYDRIVGELAGGVEAWRAAGWEVRATRLAEASEVDPGAVVDVRQNSEHETGHLPGATLVELGDLAERTPDVPASAVTTMCGHGERATTAASLLERAGHGAVSILLGGPQDWADETGRQLATG